MQKNKHLYWLLPLAGLLVGLLLYLYLTYSQTRTVSATAGTLWQALLSMLLGAAVGAGVRQLAALLNRWLPWHQHLTLRFFSGFLLNALLTLALIWAGFQLYRLLLPDLAVSLSGLADIRLKLVLLVTVASLVYVIVEFTLYSYYRFAQVQIEAVQADQARLALQYDLLRSQLNPHYLFNGLNTISALLHAEPQRAELYIRRFAQTYQYLLRTQPRQLVPLAEEISFVRTYFYLLQVRFGEQLQLEIELPPAVLSTAIPPLTLQLLLENAVKHNLVSEAHQLKIRISHPQPDVLLVRNNIVPKAEQPVSHQLGLEAIRKRYAYLTAQPVIVTKGQWFDVLLPVLPAAATAAAAERAPAAVSGAVPAAAPAAGSSAPVETFVFAARP